VRFHWKIGLTAAAAAALGLWVAAPEPSWAQEQGKAQAKDAGKGQAAPPANNLNAGPFGGGGGGRGKGKARPPRDVPRNAEGRVTLGPAPGERGVWSGSAGATIATNVRGGVDNPGANLGGNPRVSDLPFQPWARALYDYRQATLTKDDPHVRCKVSGGARMYHTPYGMEFIEFADLKRIYVLGVGGPHTYRVIYMDGRPHPADLDPSFQGHEVGRWEGDTLVVDSVGFNERFWLTREGTPHTESLHLTERFIRTDYYNLKYEATIDDPGAYTRPWTGGWNIPWQEAEMYEFICQDNNRDPKHMFGGDSQP
jgi:hypothetical protein